MKTIRKKITLILVVILLAAISQVSFSQEAYAADGNPPALKGEGDKEISPERFSEIKAGLLKKIEFRAKRLNEEKACVEAAKDMTELKKCKPERPDGPGGFGGQGGQGGQRKFQKPPMETPQ